MIPKEMEEPKELREAFETANQMSWSKEELDAYDARGIYIQDERGRIEYALEEGEKIGLEKGEKLGYDKKTREMAKTMKKEGEPIEKISRYTRLSKEEIEKL